MNKTSKILVIGCAMFALGTPLAASAKHGPYYDTARVIAAKPIYETVEVQRPVKECWNERVVYHRHGVDQYAGPLLGGVIGGVVGSRIGEGNGKKAATIAGTLLGVATGHELTHRRGRPRIVEERQCEWVDQYATEEQLVGYRVKYRYKGRTFVTRTSEHPGKRIRVRVKVDPIWDD